MTNGNAIYEPKAQFNAKRNCTGKSIESLRRLKLVIHFSHASFNMAACCEHDYIISIIYINKINKNMSVISIAVGDALKSLKYWIDQDADEFSVEKVDESMLTKMDDIINEIQDKSITQFAELCDKYIHQVLLGKRPNYRLDVFKHKVVEIDGQRLMPHHLMYHNVESGYGNFKDTQLDSMKVVLNKFVDCDNQERLVVDVLQYIVVLWTTIGFCKVSPAVARFYLAEGGKDRGKEAYDMLERRFMKRSSIIATEVKKREKGNDEKIAEQEGSIKTNVEVGQKRTYKKEKKICPECGESKFNLPRHVEDKHKWTKAKSKQIVISHSLRKPYNWHLETPSRKKGGADKKTYPDYHVPRICPLPTCLRVVKKMSEHLQLYHKLETNEEYYALLRSSRPVSKSNEAPREESSVDFETNFNNPVTEAERNDCESSTSFDNNGTMQQFLAYLMSPDGGQRERKSSLQAVSEVRTVVNVLGGQLINLFKKNKIRDDFFVNYLDKKSKPATSKHYMSSLISFMEFAVSEGLELPELCVDDFITAKLRLHKWRKTYNKVIDEQRWDREEAQMELLVSPDQWATFECSELARNAVKLLGTASESEVFTMLEYTNVRDYLMTVIALQNAHRAGVASNLTLEEFGKRKLIFSLRPQVPGQANQVFVSWNGKPLESGSVSKQIHSIWTRSGVYDGFEMPKGNINTTIIRKSITTRVHDQQPDNAQPVADLLAHSLSTAKKVYRLREREKQAVAGINVINSVFERPRPNSTPSKPNKWSKDEEAKVLQYFEKEIAAQYINISRIREKLPLLDISKSEKQIYDKIRSYFIYDAGTSSNVEDQVKVKENAALELCPPVDPSFYQQSEHDDCSSIATDVIPPTTSSNLSGQQKLFDSIETNEIKSLCFDIIKGGPISAERILEKLSKSEIGREILQKYKIMQVQTRLKYERRMYRMKKR
ncbi:uncharacterized protein LOC130642277 [Hydractinia symbiolongicarpus]|uniref:uncharacterized protein LOC130642277 n=2 Tax=Hydractinia symbiolongicarpus TaxID=13093 RepID=UPI00254B3967|nr:uncharacterized protein LOC130642277 [Hydractinia symbiolongicarpus]